MITSDPLINLKVVLGRQENECDYKEKTYHRQYSSMMAQADGLSVDKEGMNSS